MTILYNITTMELLHDTETTLEKSGFYAATIHRILCEKLPHKEKKNRVKNPMQMINHIVTKSIRSSINRAAVPKCSSK